MTDASQVSAVIVTRGDVDLSPVLDSLPREWQKIVWDNSVRPDLGVYGRYAAIEECEHEAIFVVDDDCALDPDAFGQLLDAYQPGHVIANMPERFRAHYPDSCLVGFGAIFDRDLPARAFERLGGHPKMKLSNYAWWNEEGNALFHRECDTVFTTLTPRILVDLPYTDLPWAHADNRLWKQPEHVSERRAMLDLARKVRDA